MVRAVLSIIGSMGLALLSGACSTTTATIPQIVYPEVEIKKNEPLVIQASSGNDRALAIAIEGLLSESGFHIVDRANLKEDILSKGGQVAPAMWVLHSNIHNARYIEDSPKYSKSTCYPVQGSPYEAENISYSVRASMTASVRLSRVTNDRLAFTRDFSETANSIGTQSCGMYSGPESRDALFDQLFKRLARRTVQLLIPYETSVDVTLYDVDTDILPEVNAGHALFKNIRLEDALKLYTKAKVQVERGNFDAKTKGHVLYAYGLALGYLHHDGAMEALNSAYATNPEGGYLSRMEQLRQFYKKDKKI